MTINGFHNNRKNGCQNKSQWMLQYVTMDVIITMDFIITVTKGVTTTGTMDFTITVKQ